MEFILKCMKVLVALQFDHFLLQVIAYMRVPPVCMFMSVLWSWRFLSVLDYHWGALSVRIQVLCSSRVRFLGELF